MVSKSQGESKYPDVEEEFIKVLEGLNVKTPEVIAKYVYDTGDVNDIAHVAKALNECDLSETKKRQIIKVWALKKKPSLAPEELQKLIGGQASPPAALGSPPSAAEDKKYVVDPETAEIAVAKATERPALTWDEAVKLSERIKKERGKGDEESAIVFGESGEPELNPKAKYTVNDIVALQFLKDARGKGEELTPMKALDQARQWVEMTRGVLGGGKDQSGLGLLSELDKLGLLKKPESPNDDLIALLREKTEGGGKGDEEMRGMRDEIIQLRTQLAQEKETRDLEEKKALREELGSLRGEVAKIRADRSVSDEYTLMGKALDTIDKRAGAIEDAVKGMLTRGRSPASPESPELKARVTVNIAEEAGKQQELTKLGDKLFFKPKTEQAP